MGPDHHRVWRDWGGGQTGTWSYRPRVVLALRAQPISDRPVGSGSTHRAGRCRTGRTRFSSPGCRICRCMEICLNRGWVLILPGCDVTGGWSRKRHGRILRGDCSFYAPQPISDRTVELRFPRRAGRCQPRRTRFSSQRCRRCRDMQ